MIDLKRLTDAPWEMDRHDQRDAETVYTAIHGPDGRQLFDTCNSERMEIEDNSDEDGPHYNDRIGEANLEFAALARNAFDVMMRRGWYAVPHVREKNWIVVNSYCCQLERGGNTGIYFISDDPFTALVEADKWYKENVEAK